MVNEVWGQKDHPSSLDRNTVKILALSLHITGTSQATTPQPGPLFIPNKAGEVPLWYQTILGFEKYIWWRLIFHFFGTPFS